MQSFDDFWHWQANYKRRTRFLSLTTWISNFYVVSLLMFYAFNLPRLHNHPAPGKHSRLSGKRCHRIVEIPIESGKIHSTSIRLKLQINKILELSVDREKVPPSNKSNLSSFNLEDSLKKTKLFPLSLYDGKQLKEKLKFIGLFIVWRRCLGLHTKKKRNERSFNLFPISIEQGER